jgi:tetratricopeptide (TPR) repeat protein
LERNAMSDPAELYNQAEQLKDDGKYEQAIEKFEQVLELDDKYVLAHLALAVVLGKVGKHEEAIRHGQMACELDPTDPFNFTAMSVTFQRAFAGTQNRHYIQLAEEAMARAHMLQGHR